MKQQPFTAQNSSQLLQRLVKKNTSPDTKAYSLQSLITRFGLSLENAKKVLGL